MRFPLTVLTGGSGNLVFLPGDGIWRWKLQLYAYETWQKNIFCINSGYTFASFLPPSHYALLKMDDWKPTTIFMKNVKNSFNSFAKQL